LVFFFFFLKKKFVFFRLKFSFALIPAPEMEQLANAERVLSSANCFAQSAERAARLDADVPFVPVFERGLEQVMHVVNAMADERNGLIMWRKRKQLWSVLKEIATAKQRACLFGFSRNDHAVQALLRLSSHVWPTSDQIVAKSLHVEPRGATEAKDLTQ
jgi:hypothetical protein